MAHSFFKILWVLSSSVLIVGGLLLITNIDVDLASLNVIYSLILYIIGISNVLVYLYKKELLIEPGLVMKEGIVELILAIILFFSKSQNNLTVPYFFALYFIYKAISELIIASKHSKDINLLVLYIIISVISLIDGSILFLSKFLNNITLNILLGIILIIEGYLVLARLIINVLHNQNQKNKEF